MIDADNLTVQQRLNQLSTESEIFWYKRNPRFILEEY